MLFKNNLNNLFQSNLCSIFAHIKFLKELGMRLSELKTGEKGVIIKVLGHGGFRKRIIEMGFIKGKTVEVMLNAPLKDPIKYKVLGYEVSLRRQEAEMVEVLTEEEARGLRPGFITTNMQVSGVIIRFDLTAEAFNVTNC